MWERNLQDLIRALRANKGDQSRFIAEAIDEIRKEIRSDDMELKAAAVLKLTYLEMLGYDMSWASFHVVEVMSSPRFHLKSMGYLAATQSFEQDTDVLMLTTNLLKKDLTSAKPMDIAVALNGLSHIVTPDLARDLSRDLVIMLSHSRPVVRKRAVLALYRVILKYPEAMEQGLEKLKERLEDSDPSVVGAVVNILCELARQNPKDYRVFAPPLFHILTTSSNNWVLIKVIKLFGMLTPYEPRLIKKLQPPITDLISTTPAVSLLYECVHTCIIGGMLQGASGYALAQTCVTKLAAFLDDSDQNLKYIALLALAKIVPSHPHLIADYESRILASVEDQDLSIRMRALELLSAMVNQNNLQSIVQQLLQHLVKSDSATSQTAVQSLTAAATQQSSTPPTVPPAAHSTAYRATLASRIISICSVDLYANLTDFQWYVSVLIDLAYVARAPIGAAIRDQLIDVAVRVPEVRRYAVQVCVRLLEDSTFVSAAKEARSGAGDGCEEVLGAAAWIVGEYASELLDTQKVIPTLLSPGSAELAPETVALFVQSATKIFGSWAVQVAKRWDADDMPELSKSVDDIIARLNVLASSSDFEVQERAANALELFSFIHADLSSYKPTRPSMKSPQSADDFSSNGFADTSTSAFDPIGTTEPSFPKSLYLLDPLFSSYALNPVAEEAQMSVPVPDGLDLDAWIVPEANPERLRLEEEEAERKRRKDRKGKGKGKDREHADEGKLVKAPGKKSKKRREVIEDGAGDSRSREEILAEQEEIAKAKAKRMEMLRDDPYYIFDDQSKKQKPSLAVDDLEAIPVVRLDDMPALTSLGSSPHTTPLVSQTPPSQPATFTINRSGEMPRNATPLSSHATPPTGTPARSGTPISINNNSSRLAPPPLSSGFPIYDPGAGEELPRANTPELIKITKVARKKKSSALDGSGSGKKKKKETG